MKKKSAGERRETEYKNEEEEKGEKEELAK